MNKKKKNRSRRRIKAKDIDRITLREVAIWAKRNHYTLTIGFGLENLEDEEEPKIIRPEDAPVAP